jgi:transcriptional regulator with XRE-family HTH domain
MNILEVLPRALEFLDRDLGPTTEELSSGLGVEKRTIERWREQATVPQGKTYRRLAELDELRTLLLELYEPAEAREWMRSDNPYLGGMTPADAIRAGRIDRARAAIEAIASGVYA